MDCILFVTTLPLVTTKNNKHIYARVYMFVIDFIVCVLTRVEKKAKKSGNSGKKP